MVMAISFTDKQILKIATEFRKGILGRRKSHRMCAMVSFGLQGYLGFVGLHSKVCEGIVLMPGSEAVINHIWLELPDGRVLDPTADQFNDGETIYPPVYLGNHVKIHSSSGASRRLEC
jgi:hypothetical protein